MWFQDLSHSGCLYADSSEVRLIQIDKQITTTDSACQVNFALYKQVL